MDVTPNLSECRRAAVIVFALCAALGASAATAGRPFLRDQSDLDLGAAADISTVVQATDFLLVAATRIDFAQVWLLDDPLAPNDNGVLDAFSGTLGWAILADDSGQPGALLYSGADAAPGLTDSGLDSQGSDLVRARLDFGEPITLPAGTYWLALEEGAWGSPGDGTTVSWSGVGAASGAPAHSAPPAAVPGSWSAGGFDTALVLYGAPTVWNQSDVQTALGGWDISNTVAATNFDLDAATTLSSFEVWINDSEIEDNGVVDHFSGTLGWAVYSNAADRPGTLLCSGEDISPRVFDSGVLAADSYEMFRLRGRFAGCPVLEHGRYWLAFREGAWGSPGDGDEIFVQRTLDFHYPLTYYSLELDNPVTWQGLFWNDTPFVLLEDLIFISGFEAGVTCAWSFSPGGDCP